MFKQSSCILGLQSPQGHYSSKQWMNYLMHQTYIYNPTTTPLGSGFIINVSSCGQVTYLWFFFILMSTQYLPVVYKGRYLEIIIYMQLDKWDVVLIIRGAKSIGLGQGQVNDFWI